MDLQTDPYCVTYLEYLQNYYVPYFISFTEHEKITCKKMILQVTLRRKLAYSGNPDDEVEGNGCAFQILLNMRAYGMRSQRHVFGLKPGLELNGD